MTKATWVARGSRMRTCATSFSGMSSADAISALEGVDEPKFTLLLHCTLALSCIVSESSWLFWCSARYAKTFAVTS